MKKSNKPLLVMIHGLRGSHHGLRFVGRELASEYEVLLPDLPGSGDNPELDRQTLDGHIEWLHEYISSLPSRPVIAGHSMGSVIVSHYVARYPKDVAKKVVLVSPIFRGKAGRAFAVVPYGLLRVVMAPLTAGRRYKILASRQVSWVISHYLTCDRSKQKMIDEEHYKYSGRFASARALMGDVRVSTTCEAVVPGGKDVLIVTGDKDRLTKCEMVRRRAEEAGVGCVVVNGAGHLVNYERPREVAGVVLEFLGR